MKMNPIDKSSRLGRVHWLAVRILGMMGCTLSLKSYAEGLSVAKVFGDNMVLQRECPAPVWGWARPGERVTVEFKGRSRSAAAGADGKWMVKIEPLPASSAPETLRVIGSDGGKAEFANVLVGEVWLASGQSNMGCDFRELKLTPDADSANPQIRLAGGMGDISPEPGGNRFPDTKWQECTPERLLGFSCVAYYYARELQQKLNIPIGVINMSMGCSSIESWMPPEAFASHAAWNGELEEIDRMRDIFRARICISSAPARFSAFPATTLS